MHRTTLAQMSIGVCNESYCHMVDIYNFRISMMMTSYLIVQIFRRELLSSSTCGLGMFKTRRWFERGERDKIL